MRILGILCLWLCVPGVTMAESFRVYFGTYTGAKSKGIYVAQFDSTTGKLSQPELAAETRNPSFLAVHPNERFLYAVGEVNDTQGLRAGAVNAFAIESSSGKLTPLNQQTSGGTGPCHISVDATGKCALVANYGSGSVATLPIRPDGSLGVAASVIQHTGASVNPKRQAGPHAHFITPSPDNRFALACDLGLDKVLIYQLDAAKAKLTTNTPPFAVVAPGSGPRHLAFSPDGKFIYVINEMKLSITVFAYDSKTGTMSERQTVSTLPPGFPSDEKDSCAEILVHPNGKFVYGSNRGPHNIAVYAIHSKTGELTLVQHEGTQGAVPRHFAIDPTGQWLLAENQNSDTVVVFAIHTATGKLQPTGQMISVGSPVCAVFVKAK